MAHYIDMVDLAAERIGGVAIAASDEFFAPKENLLKAEPAVWRPDEYTDRGKWMDGWESRRKRVPGYDWCIVRLGLPGAIHGLVVDTAHFTGNYPQACSLDACALDGLPSAETLVHRAAPWQEVLPRTPLLGDHRNLLAVRDRRRWSHVRLNVYPDGGVARLRVHGEVVADWAKLLVSSEPLDLAALENGGAVLASSDMFFGSNQNLIMPGRARHMGEGWETRRSRRPGHDWTFIELAARGTISRVEVDTNHFKGNHPDRCSIETCDVEDATLETLTDARTPWTRILGETPLQASTRHDFAKELAAASACTHVRLKIYPDGGVSRLRLFGRLAPRASAGERAALERWHRLGRAEAEAELLKCCGSRVWAARVADRRFYPDPAALHEAADRAWEEVGREDWLEAFRAHPRLGDRDALRKKFATAAWAAGEQAGAAGASEETITALAEGNRAYEERFGHIFILCATGKGAEEMLARLHERLYHSRETELIIAAEEQRRITRIRLEKWLQA